jgi:hypothetical protein
VSPQPTDYESDDCVCFSSKEIIVHHRPALFQTGPIALAALAALLVGSPRADGAPLWRANIRVGSAPQAVGMNPATNDLYVANSQSNMVSVLR